MWYVCSHITSPLLRFFRVFHNSYHPFSHPCTTRTRAHFSTYKSQNHCRSLLKVNDHFLHEIVFELCLTFHFSSYNSLAASHQTPRKRKNEKIIYAKRKWSNLAFFIKLSRWTATLYTDAYHPLRALHSTHMQMNSPVKLPFSYR